MMTADTEVPVHFLDWDSAFFDKRIARVTTGNLTEEQLLKVEDWARDHQIDCLYYLAEGAQPSSPWTVERHDFHLMDLRVTFGIDLTDGGVVKPVEEGKIRQATLEDLPEVQKMAGEFHTQSRFFADEHFSKTKCRQLYEIWIERDFNEANRLLWVWKENDRVAGYTSATLNRASNAAEIGLVGVRSDWRGRGIGLKLQQTILAEMTRMGMQSVEVVTQGRNISAQNLYQRSGYRLKTIDLWYHKWFSK